MKRYDFMMIAITAVATIFLALGLYNVAYREGYSHAANRSVWSTAS